MTESKHNHRQDSRTQRPASATEVEDRTLLPGIKPVRELLLSDPSRVDLVYIRKGRRARDTDGLLDLCREQGVRFSLIEPALMDRLCPSGHQGVAARLLSSGYTEYADLLGGIMDAPLPLVVALDQVQDPGNAGTLARTLYALGGAGLIIPRHNGVYLGAGARRAAAGALERLPVARVPNLAQALDQALDLGLNVYAGARTGAETEQSAFLETFRLPAVLVLGSEERGLRPNVLKRCQRTIYVPMLRSFDSLNVAQAGGILISCFLRHQLERAASLPQPRSVHEPL